MGKKRKTKRTRRDLPRRETLFLTTFFIIFVLLFGLLIYQGQTRRRTVRSPGRPTTGVENPALTRAVLAIEGLAFEEGLPRRDATVEDGDETLSLRFPVAPDFSGDHFRTKLLETLPLFGFGPVESPVGTSDREGETSLTFRESGTVPGSKQLRIILVKRALPPEESYTPSTGGARMAIVIDDLGRQMAVAKALADLPAPLTLSIMPGQAMSREVADLAARKGKEVLMHLPMEPKDYPENDPGPGALMSGMSPEEISRVLDADLVTVPGAVGINNHMGSRFTSDTEAMDRLMPFLAVRGLFFLDSYTTPDSVAYQKALAAGLKAVRRDVFLDNTDEREAIEDQLDELINLALRQGQAVGIGHPRDNTVAVLRDNLDRIGSAGVTIVPLSELVR